MRLIDGAALKKRIKESTAIRSVKVLATTLVNTAPTIDAVPVVRCKDCKHYDMGVCLKIYSDGNVHPEAWQSRRPDDFCSYGERKEGADNG